MNIVVEPSGGAARNTQRLYDFHHPSETELKLQVFNSGFWAAKRSEKGANEMAQTYTLQFIHRLNGDGTIDSICGDCFVTVATATSSAALEREERKHCCDPFLLERYKKVRVA